MERNTEKAPKSSDSKRPSSVTVIAWLIIVLAIIGLFGMLVVISAVERRIVGRLFVITLIAFPLQMAMGIGMLKGLNWARLLYLWIAPLSLMIGLFGGMLSGGLVFRAVFYVIALFILTRPPALKYFSKTKREFELTRQSAPLLSIFAPWLTVAPIVLAGLAFEPSFESPVLRGLMYQWFVIGLAAGIYPAYWYVKDKGYQSGTSFLSLGSIFGWIILWSMEDLSSTKSE